MLVIMMIASTSRKPPKVSWPIESEDDRPRRNNAENTARMMVEPDPRTSPIYPYFRARGNSSGRLCHGRKRPKCGWNGRFAAVDRSGIRLVGSAATGRKGR